MSERYNLGESVVIRGSQKMGKVVDAADSQKDGTTESVKIQLEDGTTQWHSVDSVSKMLYEVEPNEARNFMQD